MSTPINQAAWLEKAGSDLVVRDAPLPSPGPGEIVVKNAAIALNPLDNHMQDVGVFVQKFPAILGCDVAGVVHAVGDSVTRFGKGDRVIGHSINLTTGRPVDGAYQLYTVVRADKAAILPADITFTDGSVLPFAIEAAACMLSVKEPGPCMPGVTTPALALPYPSPSHIASAKKVLVVYGASSSVGLVTTQLAVAAGITVLAVAGLHNHDLVKEIGAAEVFDHKDDHVVDKVVEAAKNTNAEFVGVVDTISAPETYTRDLAILEKLGGGHLAAVHPPPKEVPANVKAGMIFAVNDVARPVFENFVGEALESGKLKCLPKARVVGKGLSSINEGLKQLKAGVSATKLVIEL